MQVPLTMGRSRLLGGGPRGGRGWIEISYMLSEGPKIANQNNRKLGVFDQKGKGSHCLFLCYYDLI